MAEQSHPYIIIGSGLTGVSAVEGIRELDPRGSILLLGAEKDLPYDRPPLTKQLWTGAKTVEQVFLHDEARALIRKAQPVSPETLRGAIH